MTAYCQQFNIASRAASFLVLENEADYKRLEPRGREEARRSRATWASTSTTPGRTLGKEPSLKQAFGRLLYQIDGRTKVLAGDDGAACSGCWRC